MPRNNRPLTVPTFVAARLSETDHLRLRFAAAMQARKPGALIRDAVKAYLAVHVPTPSPSPAGAPVPAATAT